MGTSRCNSGRGLGQAQAAEEAVGEVEEGFGVWSRSVHAIGSRRGRKEFVVELGDGRDG